MQMSSSSLFVVLIATSRRQRTHKRKSPEFFLLGPSTAVRAPIGSCWLLLAQVSVISSCHWLSVESAGRFASQVRFGTWSSQQMACTCLSVPVRNRWRLVWRWIDRLAFGSTPHRCAKTVTGEEVGDGRSLAVGWGRGSSFSDDLVAGSVFGETCQVRWFWQK